MARRFFALQPTHAQFLDTAPKRYSDTMEVPHPAEKVWADLTSDNPLSWCKAIAGVTWTSPRPFGVGTTRDVKVLGGALVVREHFFRWEEGTRKSFSVTEASLPVFKRIAEDYIVEPLGPDRSRFTWVIAAEPSAAGRPGGPANALLFRKLFSDTRKHFNAL